MFYTAFRSRDQSTPAVTIYCGSNSMNYGTGWTGFIHYYRSPGINWGYYNSRDMCQDYINPGPPYRYGQRFSCFHLENPAFSLANSGDYQAYSNWNTIRRYLGGFVPAIWPADARFVPSGMTDSALMNATGQYAIADASVHGATAWNKFRPGNPTADLGVFLGEFKDIPRMLETTARGFHNLWKSIGGRSHGKIPKEVANHWLNTQFGWLPFISDLRKFHRTYASTDAQLQRIRRQNGAWIRHGGTLESTKTSTVQASSDVYTKHSPLPQANILVNSSAPGSYVQSLDVEQRTWFEGSFRYYIPNVNSVEWEKRVLLDLYGAMPNPSLIWELTPWSWLVDWCSNVGDVVSNMSTGWAENLAAKYAFVMKSTDYTWVLNSTLRMKPAVVHNTWSYPLKWRMRTPASPFGFGLSGIDFTARQWSILSALGLSRLAYR